MTKQQIADQVMSIKQGGNTAPYSKFDRRDIYLMADTAYGEVIGKARAEMGSDFERSDFVKRFGSVQLYYDKQRDQTFFNIPVPIVDNGLLGVSPPRGNDYILSAAGSGNIYDTMEAGKIYDNEVLLHEGDRVYFKSPGKKSMLVFVRCIPKASAYKDYEELPVPSAYEGMMMQRILDLAEGQRLVVYKTKKDNNPDTK